MPEDRNLEKEIFTEALELPPKERTEFLVRACRGNDALRDRIEKLLVAAEASDGILESQEESETLLEEVPVTEGPGTVIGRYKLLQKIGEGGFGMVYMARQEKPVRRDVALKIIKLGMDTKQVVGRFEAERQALAMMDHPNIAKVLDAGASESGRPYFVMELVRGVPITEYCDDNQIGTEQRLELFVKVCQAVQHAHQKGIIHRDIKPSNVLITMNDGVPIPKVIDFGIAKATQQELTEMTVFTQFREFIGTPAYMSPEQAEMSQMGVDTRCDIYSLGVLLYELLTGKTPFDARELINAGYDEMRRRIREQEPPKPSTRVHTMAREDLTTVARKRGLDGGRLVSHLSGELDWIVMKALEKDRTRRYETANGFALDVQRYLQDEPVAAVAPSNYYRFQKFARRNRAALATAVSFAVLLIAGIIATSLLAYKASVASTLYQQASAKSKEAEEAAQAAEAVANEKRDTAERAEQIAKKRLNDARLNLYQADLPAAQLAIQEGATIRARNMLDDHIPQSGGEEDFRGFEWRYLWAKTSTLYQIPPGSRKLDGHTDLVMSREFSPDDRMVVSGGRDGQAIVWDRLTGEIRHRLKHEPEWVDDVAFSRDSRLIAIRSGTNVSLWDITGDQPVLRDRRPSFRGPSFQGMPYGRAIALSRVEDRLIYDLPAKGEEIDYRVVVYDYTAKTISHTLTNAGPIMDLSPDGRWLVTGSSSNGDHTKRFWDLNKQGRLVKTATNFGESVWFSRSGQQLYGYTDDGVRAWDLEEVLNSSPKLIGPGAKPAAATDWKQRTRDGKEVVENYSREGLVIKPVVPPDSSNTITNVYSSYFTPDGMGLYVKRAERPIELFDVATMKPIRVFNQLSPEIFPQAISPSGEILVGRDYSDEMRSEVLVVIDSRTGMETLRRTVKMPFSRAAVFPDESRLAILFEDGTVSIRDARNLEILREFSIADHLKGNFGIRFSPDGKWFAAVGDHRNLKVFDTRNWKEEIIPGQHYLVGFIDGGRRLLSWTTQGQLFESNLETGERSPRFKGTFHFLSFSVSPDQKTLAAGGWVRTVELWNLKTGRRMVVYDILGHVVRVNFSPDGTTLVAHQVPNENIRKGWIGTLYYWKAPTLEQIETNEAFHGRQGDG